MKGNFSGPFEGWPHYRVKGRVKQSGFGPARRLLVFWACLVLVLAIVVGTFVFMPDLDARHRWNDLHRGTPIRFDRVIGQPGLRLTAFRANPSSGRLEAFVEPPAGAGLPQGTGAWTVAAGLDGMVSVAIKVSSAGTLATGADPGGAITSCSPSCVVIAGLNGLSPVALKVGSDGTVATTGGAPSGTAGGDLGGSYPNPTVVALNGTNLAGLATGILYNTTATGVPTIASAANILAACTGCAPLASPTFTGTVTSPTTVLAKDGSFGSFIQQNVTACETAFGITAVSTGSATTTTGLNCVLSNAIVDAVVIRTTTTITTAATFEVGVSGSLARYCAAGTATITAGQTVVCTAQINGGSSLNASGLTAIVITFNATPGAGAMRVIVYSHQATAPTS